MTIAVRYQTRNGNTKAFAKQIAAIAGVAAQSTDTPVEQAVTLFFGGGTYFMKPDKAASAFMDTLDPTKVKQIALFTTSGGPEMVTDKALTKMAADKGIPVIGHFHKVMGGKGMKILGQSGGILKDDQVTAVKDFARQILAE